MFSSKPSEKEKKKANKTIDLTDETYTEAVQTFPLLVVDCWAPWCAPCRIVGPIVDGLARKYTGKIYFGKLNVDKNRLIASEYQIMSIPTLLVYKNGELVDRIIGALPRQMLESRITRFLKVH